MTWLSAGWIAFAVVLAGAGQTPDPPTDLETLNGSVVFLTEALKPTGLVVDAEPIAKQVVLKLKDQDGTLIPLLSDDASRAFFLDEHLRRRAVEIKGRRHPGLPYLQVLSFRVEEGGRLRTPEYFCEVCTISVRYPQTCPCCQGEMTLRMRPEPKSGSN